jgi:xanthine dehydrogenase accessory factor
MPVVVLLYGGGDLASGVAARLFRAGFQVVIAELPEPLAVRRTVAFANAVYNNEMVVEGIRAYRVDDQSMLRTHLKQHEIPVIIDPQLDTRHSLRPDVIVDGRMTKRAPEYEHPAAPLVIGLGPGFTAAENCHAVIETMRGHYLGRVYWQGSAEPDTGLPESVHNHQSERVLRAPATGILKNYVDIGDILHQGDTIAEIDGQPILARFDGLLRGLIFNGVTVQAGMKIGDLDPRIDGRMHLHISDKSLAVGGGVLEAILSVPELRVKLADTG